MTWIKFNRSLLLLISQYLFITPVALSFQKETGISFASGFGTANIVPIRLGIQRSFNRNLDTRCLKNINGYWETSFYNLSGKAKAGRDSNKRTRILAAAGVLRISSSSRYYTICPYLDLGLGIAYTTKVEIGGRELGIHYQFEDRIGVGIRFGNRSQFEVGYRAVHFSNAYLGSKNHGLNLHLLVFSYWLG